MSSVGNVPFSKWSPIARKDTRVDERPDGALDRALFRGEVAGEIEKVGMSSPLTRGELDDESKPSPRLGAREIHTP